VMAHALADAYTCAFVTKTFCSWTSDRRRASAVVVRSRELAIK